MRPIPLWPLLAITAAGCLIHTSGPRVPEDATGHEVVRRDLGQGQRRETSYEVQPGGRRLRDGAEREVAQDGALLAERSFRAGQPDGVWRTWYEDGTPRSEVDFGDGLTPSIQRHWHPNGQLAAEGSALGEAREGRWSFWDEKGGLLRAGSFHQGQRSGHWTLWTGGRKTAEGNYERGVRVGEWTLWDAEGVAHHRGQDGTDPRP